MRAPAALVLAGNGAAGAPYWAVGRWGASSQVVFAALRSRGVSIAAPHSLSPSARVLVLFAAFIHEYAVGESIARKGREGKADAPARSPVPTWRTT